MKKLLPLLLLVLVAGALAFYFFDSNKRVGTSHAAQTSFEIADTSRVGKIFIADTKGKTVTIAREEGEQWTVNGKYPARPDAVETLLKTFKNVYVQRPVSKESQEQVNRVMAGASKKVEIYDRKGKWIKTWYVGHATMDKKGTYMLLETPKYGRSTEPFIMDMKGFIGMLNTRFFMDENEWRSVVILKYDELTIKELEVEYPGSESESFKITYAGGNNIQLFPHGSSESINRFDTTLVKDYLLNFKLASFENYKTGLSEAQEDSIMQQSPFQIIHIRDSGGEHHIKLWPKKAPEGQMSEDGQTPAVIDIERIYAATEEGELALAQRFVWDKFRAPIQAFIRE